MTVVVDTKRCIGCGLCNLLCPEYALKVSNFFFTEVDQDRCVECFVCLNCCPLDAIGNIEEERTHAI